MKSVSYLKKCFLLAAASGLVASSAMAKSEWLDASRDPNDVVDGYLLNELGIEWNPDSPVQSCALCHYEYEDNGGFSSSENPFGQAWRANGGRSDPVGGMLAIEQLDSDGDGQVADDIADRQTP